MKKYLYRIPLLLCFLIAIALSFKNLREPDLWWQIRTGEWILQNHCVPKQDVFSYTYAGTPWINIKWGAEVLFALAARFAGPESIFIIQAIIACFILFFLIRAAGQLSARQPETAGDIAIVLALLCTLFGIEYRMIGRPEMFTHFFTVVFLYLLLRHRRTPSYRILILAPLQLIWANMHEAFAIGVIITAIFCFGGWVEYYLGKRKKLFLKALQPKELTVALIAEIISVAINPNGIKLLTRPLAIMGQIYQNKFTTENADFHSHEFWYWNSYFSLGLLALGIIGSVFYFRTVKTRSNRLYWFAEHFGVGYLVALVAFLYLAITAYRNVAILSLVSFPLLVFSLQACINRLTFFQKFSFQVLAVVLVLQLGIYGFIVSNQYYEITGRHDRYGLEMLSANNPVGAADFVREHHLTGRCFSDYQTSSYLLWRLQPDFKTYIDLRDLDVFPPEFFFTFAAAVNDPDEFMKQDSIYHFDYIVLYRPQFDALHYYLFNQSRFKLAFLDPVAAVYVPKANGDSSVVQFSTPRSVRNSLICYGFSQLFNPFYKSFRYTSIDCDLLASSYCLSVGKSGEAEKYARWSSTGKTENYKGLKMMGDIYYQKTRTTQNPDEKARLLDTAMGYFQRSISLNSDYADGYLGEGATYFEQSNMVKALECFEQCIARDRGNLTAYLSAAGCCNYYINANSPEAESYTQRAIGFYRKADGLNPDNPSIMLNLGLLYARANDCDNVVKYLGKIADYPGLSDRQRAQVRQCLNRCGK